jgi:glycosyltransferase involved in cell wall biosynthesis
MFRGLRIAAVLPAYNEEHFIAWAIRSLPREIFDDVIVVDDASTDHTNELAEGAGADIVVRHAENRGVGATLVTGFRASMDRGNDVAVVSPGDGQADFDALEPMLDAVANGAGLVIADRISGRDPTESGMPRYRVVGSKILAVMTWVATGLFIADPQSGYSALSREALDRIPLDRLYPRWGIHNDVLSYCALAGVPVATVRAKPVYTTPDGDRITSHIKLWDLIPRHMKVFSRIMLRRLAAWCARITGRDSSQPRPAWPVSDAGR